ncbi:hypothetical protein M8818_002650 [Zalaria obscura]|uniref:Uncharacterized protein n=1 Tax=Zalaria obscura TaxID=2024903 RepID=A0ACC3SH35_9PEZI
MAIKEQASANSSARLFSTREPPSLSTLKALTSQKTSGSSYPLANRIEKNIPVYDCSALDLSSEASISAIQDEWYHVLLHGPGVLVLKNMYTSHAVLNSANAAFDSIIAAEKAANGVKGDHFSAGLTNSRIWNSFSKHCLQDPESFFEYYSNPIMALICAAYLGPAYRITAQVNIVRPGGSPQTCHRDYHLGFQTAEDAARWPRAMHLASQLLTLQGAVAQTDMPLESGPTRLLPYSQQMEDGYLAYRLPEFSEYFEKSWVSLPLMKGDGLFFNPALMHAAGANESSDVHRSANLMQVSSAFGKPMETVDAIPLVERCWPLLHDKFKSEGFSRGVQDFISAVAEGYPFPTNLDRRPPAPGGMAPESEQDFLRRALSEGLSKEDVVHSLKTIRIDSAA